MLVKFVKEKKDSWEQFLDTRVFAYNTTQQESNHYSPFELMFGRRALLPTDLSLNTKHPEDILDELKTCHHCRCIYILHRHFNQQDG